MIKHFLRIGIVIGFCSFINISAQDYTLNLWENDIPNNKETGEEEKWVVTDVARVSNVQNPNIAVYLPPKKVATGQAVIICPGGAYKLLSYQWEGIEVAKMFNSHGIAAIILKYRLPNSSNNIVSYKSPLLDAQRAMRMVRFHAEEWNVKADKIGIMGFSAGGHLASTLLTKYDEGDENADNVIDKLGCRPDFGILMYPVISMFEPEVHMGSRINLLGEDASEELLTKFSAHLQVTDDTPPTFLVHSSNDRGVPVKNSTLFYNALINKGVMAEMHIYPFGGHGYSLGLQQHYLNSWTDRCIDWLNYLNTEVDAK